MYISLQSAMCWVWGSLAVSIPLWPNVCEVEQVLSLSVLLFQSVRKLSNGSPRSLLSFDFVGDFPWVWFVWLWTGWLGVLGDLFNAALVCGEDDVGCGCGCGDGDDDVADGIISGGGVRSVTFDSLGWVCDFDNDDLRLKCFGENSGGGSIKTWEGETQNKWCG